MPLSRYRLRNLQKNYKLTYLYKIRYPNYRQFLQYVHINYPALTHGLLNQRIVVSLVVTLLAKLRCQIVATT
jgi:hypothetical protein